jgi:hypothetical protein
MALRSAGESLAARALPPFKPPSLPNATAAGFFSDLGSVSLITSCKMLNAARFGSFGRFRFIMLPI